MERAQQRTSGMKKLLGSGISLFLWFFMGSAPARANTYLFSVTGGDILNALATTGSSPDSVDSSAYFSIFLQPGGSFDALGNIVSLDPYTFGQEFSPNPTSVNSAWDATTIADPSDLGSGSWAQFSKGKAQANVAVLTTNPSVFINKPFPPLGAPGGTWPIGWGTTTGAMSEILPDSAMFSFTIDTDQTLSGSYVVWGTASAVVSASSSQLTDPKPQAAIQFGMEVTPELTATPEPGTIGFSVIGIAVLLAYRNRQARSAKR
jgi:hypothetical protein